MSNRTRVVLRLVIHVVASKLILDAIDQVKLTAIANTTNLTLAQKPALVVTKGAIVETIAYS